MMKKTVTFLILAAVLALLAAGPVMAAGGGRNSNGGHHNGHQNGHQMERAREQGSEGLRRRQYFTLVGLISGLADDSVTVQVHSGNRFVKPYVGEVLAVQIDEATEYRRWTPAGCVLIEPAEVEVGDAASIHGTVTGEGFLAERVTVDVHADCCTP